MQPVSKHSSVISLQILCKWLLHSKVIIMKLDQGFSMPEGTIVLFLFLSLWVNPYICMITFFLTMLLSMSVQPSSTQ